MPLSRSRALSLPIVSISCNSLLGGVGDVADGHGKMNGQWRLHRQSLKRVDRLRVFTMPPIAPEPRKVRCRTNAFWRDIWRCRHLFSIGRLPHARTKLGWPD